MNRTSLFFLTLVLIPSVVFATDFTVDYIYGSVEKKTESRWQPVEIGTVVSEDSALRIGSGSVAELSSGELRITLSEAGTYFMSELRKSSRQVTSWGIGQMVLGKIRDLFRGQPEIESTTMGVRADKASDDFVFDWMDEEVAAVEEGKSLMAVELYEEAVGYFQEALELADEPGRALYLFYIGYAYAMEGKNGPALRYLNESEPSPLMAHYGDYVLLKGQLLLEGQAYRAALELFDPFLEQDQEHGNAQTVLFLSAFCSSQLGNKADAKRRLQEAYNLDPSSEAGEKARSMLDFL